MPDGGASPVQRPAADLAVYDAIAVPVLLHRGEQILHANPAMLCLLACGLD